MATDDSKSLNCCFCDAEYTVSVNQWKSARYKKKNKNISYFCSHTCKCKSLNYLSTEEVSCLCCGNTFNKLGFQIKKSPNHFCSKSCSVTYNNTHKTSGIRRSKLECWLETRLTSLYPDLSIHYGRKDTINSELDIYIPSLSLAFELNGIFHYEPIFGPEKLHQIQNNDNRKFQACLDKQIELCIIDSSGQRRFTEKSSEKFLNIITHLVNIKLSKIDYVEVV